MAHSRSFWANQRARNAIAGAENILKAIIASYEKTNFIVADGTHEMNMANVI